MTGKSKAREDGYWSFIKRKRTLLARAALYDHWERNFSEWYGKLKLRIPDNDRRDKFIELAKKRRVELRSELRALSSEEGRAYAKMASLPFSRYIAPLTSVAQAASECPVLEGIVAANRFYIHDQGKSGDAEHVTNSYEYLNDTSGIWESIRFKHYLEVGDACLKSDLGMVFGVAVIQYEFPTVPCDGELQYEGNLSLHLSTFKSGSFGALNAHVLIAHRPDGSQGDPAYGDFTWTSQGFGSSGGYDYASIPVVGRFAVQAGKKPKLFIALDSVSVAGEDTVFGTNGWSYFMVWRPNGGSRFGLKYSIG